MTWVWVIVGGMIGAPTRYLADRLVQSVHRTAFPWGTFTVNVIASFVLGFVGSATANAAVGLAVGTGFCGALSTYSTFSYESMRLIEGQKAPLALANAGLSIVVGLSAAIAGAAAGGVLG